MPATPRTNAPTRWRGRRYQTSGGKLETASKLQRTIRRSSVDRLNSLVSSFAAERLRLREPERLLVPLTIFLGAFLLFEVEPLIAKMILPWFGGSAEVWIVCLLFFQAALLAGYLYANLLTTRLDARRQFRLHVLLLLASLVWLPIFPSDRWKPTGGEDPLLLILGVLTSAIGLPFLLLSATGPLVQAWMARARPPTAGAPNAVYRFYALSNFGSLLALLSYPVLVEPWLATRAQAWIWSLAYGVFVLLCIGAAWRQRIPERASAAPAAENTRPRPKLGDRVIWFLLATAASALLLAVTNHMLRNIAAIPLLWVLPLALYLLSFILCFENPRWYYRPVWYVLFAAAMGTMMYFVIGLFLVNDILAQLAFYAGGFFAFCMVCHGELAALKPAPRHLTGYYLTIAAGGAAGGLLVAAIAPSVFHADYDLPLLLPVVSLLAIFVAWRRLPRARRPWLRWVTFGAIFYAWNIAARFLVVDLHNDLLGDYFSVRNFYSELRVTRWPVTAKTGPLLELRNGNVVHGREFLASNRLREPTSYYARQSGVGITLEALGKDGPLNVGVIGLGAGVIAAYGRAADSYRFYEINPLVRTIATKAFRFLALSPAHWSIVLGDARLALEREAPRRFDVLAVDAFSSDAIPVHLLTREAFALYWRHLKPNGVLAVHVTNKFIDLAPIVALAARQNAKTARLVSSAGDSDNAIDPSVWVLVTSRPGFFSASRLKDAKAVGAPAALRPWTDDYSNLWQVLK